MRRLLLLTAIALVVAATGTTAASAHSSVTRAQMIDALRDIRPHTNNVLASKCRMGYNYQPIYKIRFVHWTWHLWKFQRHPRAHNVSSVCISGSFDTILRRAASLFGVDYEWIHGCSHSEGNGGHPDYPRWNTAGSGAYGWMQFMRGTFYGYVDRAFAAANRRGANLPAAYKQWGSKVGQAYTAAYMFSIGLSSHWVGARC